jgi:hypothetical protein
MATRRINPRLLAAFESASVEPFDMDSPGRVVEVPVPAEQFRPNDSSGNTQSVRVEPQKTRLQMVQEYLEQKLAPMGPPDFGPDVDVGAAREQDAQRDFGAGMLAAGQAFTGNRRAVGQLQETNANETKALGAQAARRKAIADYYAAQDERALDEARVLSSAAVEPREASKPSKTTEQIDRELAAKEFANETGRIKVETVKPPKAPKAPDAAPLRKEFDALPEVKEYKGVYGAFEKVNLAAKSNGGKGSPAGDLALIYAFNKILDYGSAVKEAEFNNAQAAGSLLQKSQAAVEQVRSGKRLTDEQTADFVAQAKNVANAGRTLYDKAVKRYQGFAEKKGLSPEDVAQDVGEVGAASVTTPEKPPEGMVTIEDPANPGQLLTVSKRLAEKLQKGAK